MSILQSAAPAIGLQGTLPYMCPPASQKSSRLASAFVFGNSTKAMAGIVTSTSSLQHSGIPKQLPNAGVGLSIILMSPGGLGADVIVEVEVIADFAVRRCCGDKIPPGCAGIAAAGGINRLLIEVGDSPAFGKGHD